MFEERERRIRERAHALWEQAGRSKGRHDEHWHQASHKIGEGSGQQQDETSGSAEPPLKGVEPAPGESLEEIARGEHQGP